MEFDFQKSSICGHVVKNITNYYATKSSSHVPPTPVKEYVTPKTEKYEKSVLSPGDVPEL